MLKNIRKIVLWLFIIMIVSFSISIILFRSAGVNFWDFANLDSDFSGFDQANNVKGKFTNTINDESYFDLESVNKINVSTASTDIRFIPEDRADIKVHYYGSIASSNNITLPNITSELENTTLNIKINHKNLISLGFSFFNLNLDVYIPREYSKSIMAKTASGDVSIDNLGIENLNLESVSGDIKSESVYTEKTSFKSVSGDIKVEDYKGELTAETVSGDLSLDISSSIKDIYTHSISGDIKIKLPNNSEFYLESKTTSGEIICDFPISIEGKLSDKNINGSVGNGDTRIEVSTVSGDVKISKK